MGEGIDGPARTTRAILYGRSLQHAKRVLVTVPGALTQLKVFDRLTSGLGEDTAVVQYPFPGVDGRDMDSVVRIGPVAHELAGLVNTSPAKRVDLVGISAGGAICLEMRGILTAQHISTAIIAGAPPAPGLASALVPFGGEVLKIARNHQGLQRREIYEKVFQLLLLGQNPNASVLDNRDAAPGPSIIPTPKMLAYHGMGAVFWRLSRRARQSHSPLHFFHGTKDMISRPAAIAKLAARFQHAKITWYADRGHLPFLAHPALFEDIRRFWTTTQSG